MSLNKLGHYIFKRVCKDQKLLRKTRPMNTYGLYVNGGDIQRYVNDYLNYGMDYMGDDNVAADDVCHYSGLPSVSSYSKDKTKHYLEGFFEGDWKIDTYWDEAEGKEE